MKILSIIHLYSTRHCKEKIKMDFIQQYNILIPIVSGILTLVASILITSLQNRTELNKIKSAAKHKYAKS